MNLLLECKKHFGEDCIQRLWADVFGCLNIWSRVFARMYGSTCVIAIKDCLHDWTLWPGHEVVTLIVPRGPLRCKRGELRKIIFGWSFVGGEVSYQVARTYCAHTFEDCQEVPVLSRSMRWISRKIMWITSVVSMVEIAGRVSSDAPTYEACHSPEYVNQGVIATEDCQDGIARCLSCMRWMIYQTRLTLRWMRSCRLGCNPFGGFSSGR